MDAEAETPTTATDGASPSASDLPNGTVAGNSVAVRQWHREPGDAGCHTVGHRAARLLHLGDTDPSGSGQHRSAPYDRGGHCGLRRPEPDVGDACEQSDFLTPVLTSPDQTAVTDEPTIRKIAALIAAQKHRVMLVRPDAPDASANASKKPFSAPGTYVIYNASSQLTADVVVQCSGQDQTWTFLAEADPSTGQVNCTVEPSRSNALARQIFQNNC